MVCYIAAHTHTHNTFPFITTESCHKVKVQSTCKPSNRQCSTCPILSPICQCDKFNQTCFNSCWGAHYNNNWHRHIYWFTDRFTVDLQDEANLFFFSNLPTFYIHLVHCVSMREFDNKPIPIHQTPPNSNDFLFQGHCCEGVCRILDWNQVTKSNTLRHHRTIFLFHSKLKT